MGRSGLRGVTIEELRVSLRRIVSLSMMLSIVGMLVSSIILYIVPQGRIAYWSGWTLLGLSKSQWGAIHTNLGFLMLVSGAFHVYFNWRPLTSYMKNKARDFRLFTPNFNVALLVFVAFVGLTIMALPPTVWIQDLRAKLEEGAAEDLGEPPYGHAEQSSLRVLLRNVGMAPDVAKANLENGGIQVVDPEASILDIASDHGMTPKELFEIIRGPTDQRTKDLLPIPTSMPKGSGRLTLEAFCQQYNLDLEKSVAILKAAGLAVDPQLSLKDIGANNSLEALDLLDILREGYGD